VLMEDVKHRVRRRLERMCLAHGVDAADLADWLHLWFRPPLRLADPAAVADLTCYAAEFELDLIQVDNWSYVASGDSNDADIVTPQLAAFASIREARPGMAALLVQHARKQGQDRGGERLTDIIRNSSAFGAWYDAGLVLSRPNEHAPVTVRAELRDRPAPAPFVFTVEDEYPGDRAALPSGYLRLQASDKTPATIQREAAAEQVMPAVLEHVTANPGTSQRQLRIAVKGDNGTIDVALRLLEDAGKLYIQTATKPGQANRVYPGKASALDRAATALPAQSVNRAECAGPPKGAAQRTHGSLSLLHDSSAVSSDE
jgi:hypothetical protein